MSTFNTSIKCYQTETLQSENVSVWSHFAAETAANFAAVPSVSLLIVFSVPYFVNGKTQDFLRSFPAGRVYVLK